MNKFAIAAAAFLAFGTLAHAEDVKPCEDALKDMRDAKTAAKLADADMKKVEELETKGVERCNADDDKRADGFFADAMKIMGK